MRRSSSVHSFLENSGGENIVYAKLICFILVMLWICSTTAGLRLSHALSSKFGGRVNVFVNCMSNNTSKYVIITGMKMKKTCRMRLSNNRELNNFMERSS